MVKYLVKRKNDSVVVAILKSRRTGLYSFVNLTKGHICECEFANIEDAIKDMKSDRNVISYEVLNDH